ncbi:MAG: PorT family protein [Saprospiraceae bacterium]|nr:PorT family protein [Saprospiraceae bacterium]
MKNLITLLVATIFSLQVGMSQWSTGIRIGTAITNTSGNGIIESAIPMEWETGLEIGIRTEYGLANALSVVSGVQYSRSGFSIDQGLDLNILGLNIPIEARADFNINYIETPVMLKYTMGDKNLQYYGIGGITTSYAASGSIQPVARVLLDINLPSIDINFSDNYLNRWNVAATIGAGLQKEVGQGKIFGEIAYEHGLSNLVNTVVDLDLKNKGFSLGIGYTHSF